MLFKDLEPLPDFWARRNVTRTEAHLTKGMLMRGVLLQLIVMTYNADGRVRQLCQLVSFYHMSRCQDPRDSVYGLLGMVDLVTPFDIDYDYSTEELFARTLLYLQLEAEATLPDNLPHGRVIAFLTIVFLMDGLHVTADTVCKLVRTMPDQRKRVIQQRTIRLGLNSVARLVYCDVNPTDTSSGEASTLLGGVPTIHTGPCFRRLALNKADAQPLCHAQHNDLLECHIDGSDVVSLPLRRNKDTNEAGIVCLAESPDAFAR